MPTPIVTNQKAAFAGTGVNIAIATEAVFATPAAPTTYLDVTTHNLAPVNNLIANMVMRKSVGQVAPGVGSVSVKGDMTCNATPDSIGPILVAAMGLDTVTASGGGYSHAFSMQNPLNSYSIATQDSTTFLGVGTFVGSKCDKLNISCKPGGFLEIKSSWMSQTLTYSASSTMSPVYSTAVPWEFAHLGSIYNGLGSSVLNNVPFDCVDFNLDLSNNLHDRKGSTGGRFSIAFGETVRKVTGSFTIEMDSVSANTYNNLLWGTPTGPSPGLLARVPLAFTLTQSGSAYNPSITFKVGALTVTSATITRSKNNVLTQAVQFEVSESIPNASDDITITMVNGSANAYS